MRTLLLCIGLVLCIVLGGCDHSSTPRGGSDTLRGKLTLTGSSTVAPLAGEIAKRFEALHPDVRIDVQTGGSSQGIADARRGTADIGMASRALHDNERELDAHTIALDGITVIVHRDNPVTSLTDQQIIDIFTGSIRNWSEVGGNEDVITVANKADGRATLELFLSHFKLQSADIRADVVIGDNQHGIRTVSGTSTAIGYVSIGAAEFEAGRGTAIKLLPMSGVEPTSERVRDGDFPLSRPLNLITHGERSALVQRFLDYATSSAVNDLVEAQFFVPIAE